MAETASHFEPGLARPFFSSITIKHGPQELLARYFLAVEQLLGDRAMTLELISFEHLLDVNRANRDSWLPLTPTFSVEYNDLAGPAGYCFAARNRDGTIIVTHASRLFDWQTTSFHDEAEALRLFYQDPARHRQPGETCCVIAPVAQRLRGNVVYSGATWYHPMCRGTGLPAILSPLNRAYAMSQWDVDVFTGMVSQTNMDRALPSRTGHQNAEFGVLSRASTHGDVDYSIVWSTPDFIIAEFEQHVSRGNGIGVPIDQRRA